jgi:hypothetical protein
LGLLAGFCGWARWTPEENRIGKSFADVNGKRKEKSSSQSEQRGRRVRGEEKK